MNVWCSLMLLSWSFHTIISSFVWVMGWKSASLLVDASSRLKKWMWAGILDSLGITWKEEGERTKFLSVSKALLQSISIITMNFSLCRVELCSYHMLAIPKSPIHFPPSGLQAAASLHRSYHPHWLPILSSCDCLTWMGTHSVATESWIDRRKKIV